MSYLIILALGTLIDFVNEQYRMSNLMSRSRSIYNIFTIYCYLGNVSTPKNVKYWAKLMKFWLTRGLKTLQWFQQVQACPATTPTRATKLSRSPSTPLCLCLSPASWGRSNCSTSMIDWLIDWCTINPTGLNIPILWKENWNQWKHDPRFGKKGRGARRTSYSQANNSKMVLIMLLRIQYFSFFNSTCNL